MINKHKKTLLIIVLIMSFAGAFAQSRKNSKIEIAKKYKEKYKDFENVYNVYIDNNKTFTFKVNRNSKKLEVNEKTKQIFISIKNHSETSKYVFYDSNSEIKKIRLLGSYSKFKDEYVKINDLFYHDQRVKYTNYEPYLGDKFTFEYNKIYFDAKYFTMVYFSDSSPIIKGKYEFVIPKNVDVELKEFNFDGYNITKTKKFDSKKNANVITYILKDIPPNPIEFKQQGPTYLYPHVMVLSKSYTFRGKKSKIFETVADQYNWYHSLIRQMKENPIKLTKQVNKLTAGAKTKQEKVKNIFYWVQDNIRYIAFEDGIAGFKPDESQNVLNKRYGDCKGMTNLTTAMLKKAGFDARRTWIGTRRIAHDYSTPNLSVDNHMICTLFLDGKTYYLDATETYVPFGEYAERIQGRQVMIEDGAKFMLKKVPVHKAIHNKKSYVRNMKIEGDNLIGNVVEIYKGQSRTSFLQAFNSLESNNKKDALESYLKSDDGNYILSNIKTSDLTKREKDIEIKYDYKLKNAVSSFDDEMYIDLDYDKDFGGLDLEKRKTAYQLYSKTYFEAKNTLEIPQGYKIDKLPENLQVDNEDFKVNINFKKEGNKLIYTKKFIFPNALIKKENIKKWQEFYVKLKQFYNSQLTLIKQ